MKKAIPDVSGMTVWVILLEQAYDIQSRHPSSLLSFRPTSRNRIWNLKGDPRCIGDDRMDEIPAMDKPYL